MRVALLQINPTVGDLAGNARLILDALTRARAEGADLAVLLKNGAVGERFRKALLPTYDVFDEDRYFEPFQGPQVLEICGKRLGISICEDIWNDHDFWKRRRYHHDPIDELVRAGAHAIVNLSASPFTVGKY